MATDRDFDTLFHNVYPRLVSLGVLKCGEVDTARDLAQETMVRAHSRWSELSGYDSPAAWCHTVMVNLLIDHHRGTSSERRAVQRLDAQHAVTTRRDVDPTAASALDQWQELTTGLTEQQRLVVTLFYADDLSVEQIASLVGRTRGAVKATLFKARRTLRRQLQQREGADRRG
ncbi:MAG: RNA polymerase sigma factor [Actinomycetota bacterium]